MVLTIWVECQSRTRLPKLNQMRVTYEGFMSMGICRVMKEPSFQSRTRPSLVPAAMHFDPPKLITLMK